MGTNSLPWNLRRCLLLFDEARPRSIQKLKEKWQKQLQTTNIWLRNKRRIGLGRFLGDLVWSMSYAGPILDKLSEELSEDVLKIVKMDVDENQIQRVLALCLSLLFFSKDGQVVKQVCNYTAEQNPRPLWLDMS